MSNLPCSIFLLIAFALTPLAGHAQTNQPSPDEEAILMFERATCNAYLNADADFLEKALTDDFSFTDSYGAMNTKAGELAEVRKKETHYTTFENHDMKVHQHDDAAVVIGRTTVKGSKGTEKPFEVEVQFTDVLIRSDSRWHLLAGHVSRVSVR